MCSKQAKQAAIVACVGAIFLLLLAQVERGSVPLSEEVKLRNVEMRLRAKLLLAQETRQKEQSRLTALEKSVSAILEESLQRTSSLSREGEIDGSRHIGEEESGAHSSDVARDRVIGKAMNRSIGHVKNIAHDDRLLTSSTDADDAWRRNAFYMCKDSGESYSAAWFAPISAVFARKVMPGPREHMETAGSLGLQPTTPLKSVDLLDFSVEHLSWLERRLGLRYLTGDMKATLDRDLRTHLKERERSTREAALASIDRLTCRGVLNARLINSRYYKAQQRPGGSGLLV